MIVPILQRMKLADVLAPKITISSPDSKQFKHYCKSCSQWFDGLDVNTGELGLDRCKHPNLGCLKNQARIQPWLRLSACPMGKWVRDYAGSIRV